MACIGCHAHLDVSHTPTDLRHGMCKLSCNDMALRRVLAVCPDVVFTDCGGPRKD